MDRTGIIVVSICGALLLFWFFETAKLQQNKMALEAQRQAATNAVVRVQNPPATTTASPVPSAPAATPVFSFSTNAPEQLITITVSNANMGARYTFTSRGGGLKLVELLKYPETISARWTKTKAALLSASQAEKK